MRFDWDLRKAVSNHLKHGVSFEEAITVFDDPKALRAPDLKHSSAGEARHWLHPATWRLPQQPHSGVEGEAPRALPVEGATQAPVTSKGAEGI